MQHADQQGDSSGEESDELMSSAKAASGVFLRGLLMGLAELVPGVSGGTIAFISGIYYRLIKALTSFGFASLTLVFRPTDFWRHHHLSFLAMLGLGMVVGIVLFARLIGFMLVSAPPVLWAFFFAVIMVSVYQIGAARPKFHLLVYGSLGLTLGLIFLSLPPQDLSGSLVSLFFAAMIAVSAWILPGISGSFVLLLFGLYDDVITAVNTLDGVFLIVLAAGCASGLLLFSRLLSWLLNQYQDALLALLTGFMVTALVKLWPWQAVQDASAGSGQLLASMLLPHQYAQSGREDFWLLALVAAAVGGVGTWLLARFAPR